MNYDELTMNLRRCASHLDSVGDYAGIEHALGEAANAIETLAARVAELEAAQGSFTLPAFIPLPAFLRVNGSNDTDTSFHIELEIDDLMANDLNAMHKTSVVLMPEDIWCLLKHHIRGGRG